MARLTANGIGIVDPASWQQTVDVAERARALQLLPQETGASN